MHRHLVPVLVLLPLIAAGADADAAKKEKPVPTVASIVHDFRDLWPEVEKKSDAPDAGIPAYSVRTGYWTGYADFDADHDGLLSQTELKAVIASLKKQLREHHPDAFSAMDTDGDEEITYAEFKAYQAGHR